MNQALIEEMQQIGRQAKNAANALLKVSGQEKNAMLSRLSALLTEKKAAIQAANAQDCEQAAAAGLDAAAIDRLRLSDKALHEMQQGIAIIRDLPEIIGKIDDLHETPQGFRLGKMRMPLGVIGMIYESRPNVTIDAAALCLKASNALILRGGSEAFYSNALLTTLIQQALRETGLPEFAVQSLPSKDREAVGIMLTMQEFIDVLIPRGGKSLIARVSAEAKMPVLKHLDGVCHVFIDRYADYAMAEKIALNAKTQRLSTCNTMETLLIDEAVAEKFLPPILQKMLEAGVEIRGCPRTKQLFPEAKTASEADWYAEYLAAILAVRVVENLDAAIAHIQTYGSAHTDSIVTSHWPHAERFLREVDSSSVMLNASTRLADGFQYGLGAEIGISTDRLHARGPVALEGLTNQKFIVLGHGHVRS
jgi:glutamate-5-semialdehyde dehydrogenase